MILDETYTMTNGVQIPKIGLGTWRIDDDKVAQPVAAAIKMGYRHIDTAQTYGNERGVGEGIRASGIARDELFVTSKVEAEFKTYEETVDSINESLEKLDIEYIDLMLIHSPQPWDDFRTDKHYFKENLEVWKALEEFYEAGKLKAIGVSNFKEEDLDNLLEHVEIKPMVNQILTHISNTPFALIDYCKDHDILVEAYSPIAHGEILNHPGIKKLADKYEVSVPQLCIRYCLEMGLVVLPKSENPDHIKNNMQVDFEISADDMEILKGMDRIEDYGEANQFSVFSTSLKDH